MRILYVEDNTYDAELTRRELNRQASGHHVDVVPMLRDAREHLAADSAYDLLLLDLQLPDGSGLDLLAEVRERALPLAIVVLTGSGDEEAAVAALRTGADDYLIKRPDYLSRLPQRLESILAQHRAEAARRTRPLRVLYAEHTEADIDLTRRHLERHAPYIHLDAVYNAYDILQRLSPETQPPPYDVLLLDYRLPGSNALEILKEIRQERGLDLPIVLVTGQGNEDIATQAWRLGATDYLVKNSGYLFKLPIILENAFHRVELMREQAALRESEARYRRLAENAQYLIYRYHLKPQPGFEYVNPASTAITGYTPEEHYADPELGFKLIHPEDRPLLAPLVDGQVVGPPSIMRWIRKDGAVIWTEQRNVPVTDAKGDVIALEGIARDITERKRAEEQLRQSEENFRLLFENNPHPMWVYDLETLAFVEVNNAAVARYGYTRDEFLAMRLTDIRPPEDVPRLLETVRQERPILQHSGEWRHRLKDGTVIDVAITSHHFEYLGRPAALVVAQDITERKRIELAEREQRILAEALADTASALINAFDQDVDTVMNSILEHVARVVPHDAANIMLIEGDQVHPVYWRGYAAERHRLMAQFSVPLDATPSFHDMFATGLPSLISYTEQNSSWIHHHTTQWVQSYVAAPIRSHGKVIGFLNLDSTTPGFFTERHAQRLQAFADQASIAIEQAQLYAEIRQHADDLEQRVVERTAELQRSEARYRAIIEDQTDMVCRFERDGSLTFVNNAFCTYFDCPAEDLIGTSLFALLSEDDRAILQQRLAMLSRENPVVMLETHEITSAVMPQWIHWIGRMLFDAEGEFVEYQAVGRDITERKLAEDRLRQMLEREMELGELKSRYVSMAAHDLRNPLAVIQSAIDLLHRYDDRLNADQKEAKFTGIETSIKVMVAMLDDILTIGQVESGKLTFVPESLDLLTFCDTIIAEIRQTTGGMQPVFFNSKGGCGTAYADPKLLRHILGNLLSNAIKYSPEDRIVTFTLNCQPDAITFCVQDQGIGIPASEQVHLYEPFHRASNVQQIPGTGLGLSIVKRSVDLHGGTITAESEEGVGTTFTVVIPQIPLDA